MEKVSVIEGQTLLDIAIQQYGHLDGVFILMDDNSILTSITDIPTPGIQLWVRTGINKPDFGKDADETTSYFKFRYMKVSSGHKNIEEESSGNYVAPGYWATGYTKTN